MSGGHVVVMGVAGCGKSALGQRLAQSLGLPLIEGDSFHPPANVEKMRQGLALTDHDRAGWLARLATELASRPAGAVLTCSALKRDYRERLRAAVPDLRFVHIAIDQPSAVERVGRRAGHFYPPSLVASQFAALEDPSGERGVVVVDGLQTLDVAAGRALAGLAGLAGTGLPWTDPPSGPAG